ncbi:uncharacterized protein EV422DRAFT_41882 [Fimicolochytrium jonesii]|uniref:uncharacterized protein n=1 Tax=Fimicolochytrium jonesii TaxID=1396493 RepID=UPI0022FDCAC4|nr:uncharacterized protein EV422DRAFT_41882 [Fimicolochytrium jonesii]KAI8821416.1 hypothetical protein EV422DRAFT_41882 [Fimicolochytrium jonesii]
MAALVEYANSMLEVCEPPPEMDEYTMLVSSPLSSSSSRSIVKFNLQTALIRYVQTMLTAGLSGNDHFRSGQHHDKWTFLRKRQPSSADTITSESSRHSSTTSLSLRHPNHVSQPAKGERPSNAGLPTHFADDDRLSRRTSGTSISHHSIDAPLRTTPASPPPKVDWTALLDLVSEPTSVRDIIASDELLKAVIRGMTSLNVQKARASEGGLADLLTALAVAEGMLDTFRVPFGGADGDVVRNMQVFLRALLGWLANMLREGVATGMGKVVVQTLQTYNSTISMLLMAEEGDGAEKALMHVPKSSGARQSQASPSPYPMAWTLLRLIAQTFLPQLLRLLKQTGLIAAKSMNTFNSVLRLMNTCTATVRADYLDDILNLGIMADLIDLWTVEGADVESFASIYLGLLNLVTLQLGETNNTRDAAQTGYRCVQLRRQLVQTIGDAFVQRIDRQIGPVDDTARGQATMTELLEEVGDDHFDEFCLLAVHLCQGHDTFRDLFTQTTDVVARASNILSTPTLAHSDAGARVVLGMLEVLQLHPSLSEYALSSMLSDDNLDFFETKQSILLCQLLALLPDQELRDELVAGDFWEGVYQRVWREEAWSKVAKEAGGWLVSPSEALLRVCERTLGWNGEEQEACHLQRRVLEDIRIFCDKQHREAPIFSVTGALSVLRILFCCLDEASPPTSKMMKYVASFITPAHIEALKLNSTILNKDPTEYQTQVDEIAEHALAIVYTHFTRFSEDIKTVQAILDSIVSALESQTLSPSTTASAIGLASYVALSVPHQGGLDALSPILTLTPKTWTRLLMISYNPASSDFPTRRISSALALLHRLTQLAMQSSSSQFENRVHELYVLTHLPPLLTHRDSSIRLAACGVVAALSTLSLRLARQAESAGIIPLLISLCGAEEDDDVRKDAWGALTLISRWGKRLQEVDLIWDAMVDLVVNNGSHTVLAVTLLDWLCKAHEGSMPEKVAGRLADEGGVAVMRALAERDTAEGSPISGAISNLLSFFENVT